MKKYIFWILTVVFVASCAEQLEITPPNRITDEQIKEMLASGDTIKIDLILGSMANNMPKLINFAGIQGQGGADGRYYTTQGLDCMRNLEGNDIVFSNRIISGVFGQDEYNLVDFISTAVDKNVPYWYYGWQTITQANKMLFYLDDQTVGSNKRLKEYKARGLLIRAYAYNFLMENYQDAYLQGGKAKLGIMLYDTYSPTQPSKERSSSEATYLFIKKDINDAIALFGDAGVGYTASLTDLDLGVAYFLQARVALWTGDWQTVISACNNILSQYPDLISEDNYGGKNIGTDEEPEFRPNTNAFLCNAVNPEVIFGYPAGEAQMAHNAWMNPFVENYGGLSGGFQRIDNRLYEKIADTDVRQNCFLSEDFGDYAYPTNGTKVFVPVYTNLKFAATHPIGSDDKKQVGRVDCYYMRTSEALLMKAEAQAQAGDESGAKATLNTLLAARTKSDADVLTCDNYPSMNGLTVMQMIQLQTRIELWGEGGREFYNNKRWNISVDRTSSSNHVNKGTYTVAKMTLQIPENEIIYNPLCQQN